jgi:lysozyme
MLSWLRRLVNRSATTNDQVSRPAQAAGSTSRPAEAVPSGASSPAAGTEQASQSAGAEQVAGAEQAAGPHAGQPVGEAVAATGQAGADESPVSQAGAAEAAPKGTILGVDVSSFQGLPASWRGEAGNIKWAAVKLTELQPNGVRYVNPTAAADWAFLDRQGLGRVAYLFAHPSVNALATVEFFTAELRSLGLKDADAVMLDLEVTDGLGPAQVNAWAADVLASLAGRLHRKPLLYTFLSFAEAGNTASLGKYPLWIADPSSPIGQPRVPAPWHQWTIHQYSITAPIDRDVANFPTLAAMSQALGKPEGPQMQDLGGTITGDVIAVRWDNGVTVIAGLGTNGFVQTKRFHPTDGTWGPWRNVSLTKALGAPGMIAWGAGNGHLYYTNESGAVIELGTTDSGATWS